jgi:zinc protease
MSTKQFKTLMCGALVCMATVAFAQKDLPDNFYYSTLDNGLEVLVVEDQSVPLVTIELAVHNGAYTESPEYDGLSHLYEHMFFKANKDIPSQEKFMERVNELGISFNGTTSNERVNYFITLSNTSLRPGLEFMNSAIRYPLFLEEEMKNENPVVDGEFQRAESSPVFFLSQDMNHHLWKDNYSRKNTIGDHDIILSATPEKMKKIQKKYYYPNNTLIVVAGAVDHEKVQDLVKGIYGDWEKSDFDIFEKYPIPEMEPLKESKSYITVNENAQVPIMMIGLHGPKSMEDKQATYAADVFHTALNLESSKFQQNLVQSGLAYQAGGGYTTLKHTGPIQLFFVPNPQKIDTAIEALEAEIQKFDDPNYLTDEQLQAAKNQLAIQDIYSRESTSDFVHSLTFWWASADLEYYTNYVDNLEKVTRKDINKYVNEYIKGQPNVTGLLVSPAMKESMGLDKIEPITM